MFFISATSRGKEKVIEVDSGDKLEFLPNMLREPIFNPQILSSRDEPRTMTPEASTSSSNSNLDGSNTRWTFNTKQTISDNDKGSSS